MFEHVPKDQTYELFDASKGISFNGTSTSMLMTVPVGDNFEILVTIFTLSLPVHRDQYHEKVTDIRLSSTSM